MYATGRPAADIVAEIDQRRSREPDVHGARLFGLVYPSGDHALEDLVIEVNRRYLFGNALNPFKFPELAAMESEVVAAAGSLFRIPDGGGGTMTSGGTESILMSMLVNRERARERGIARPQILAPDSAHPAYAKAAHYFGMEVVRVPLDDAWRADVAAARALITERAAVVVASAFCYPYGVMDPVEELAGLAAEHGAGCHVDACIGGFVLPFMARCGRSVPPWDFSVPGVTEISADIHKYGYAPKGASVVLHRDDDWFARQVFLYDAWGSGLYGSPGVAGARPAAPIATAWAVLQHLGVDGYVRIMSDLLETVDVVRDAIDSIEGLDIVGAPIGPVMAMQSDRFDTDAIGDVMDDRGWHLNRNTRPKGLHLMLSPAHRRVRDALVADLRAAVVDHGTSRGIQARYS